MAWNAYEEPDWEAEFDALEPHTLVYADDAGREQETPAQHVGAKRDLEDIMQEDGTPRRAAAVYMDDSRASEQAEVPTTQQRKRIPIWVSTPAVETVSVPHKDKAKFGGEDGHFVCRSKDGRRLVVGVADGVGGSRSEDDPETLVAEFVRDATSKLADALSEHPELEEKEVVLQVLSSMPEAPPSTTLCFGILEPGRNLRIFNLGDSRLAVFRGGHLAYMSASQQYDTCWNAPLQVGGGSRAAADLEGALVEEFEVLPGDVIVTGTDGYWDNTWAQRAAQLVGEAIADRCGDAQGIARVLANDALANRYSETAIVPFWVACALADGLKLEDVPVGGKEDDLTLQVLVVPEVVLVEEEEEGPCCQQMEEEEKTEAASPVSTAACLLKETSCSSFFDGFCNEEEEDQEDEDDVCSLEHVDGWERLPSSTSSPFRATDACLSLYDDIETGATCDLGITGSISSGSSGACGQVTTASSVIDCSQTGGVVGQEEEGVGVVGVGAGNASFKGEPRCSSVFQAAAAAEGFPLSTTTSLRSEALLGLSPQPSWGPEALDAAAATAMAASAAAAALNVLAASAAGAYSNEVESEGSGCSSSSHISGCSNATGTTRSSTPTAAAAAANLIEGDADAGHILDSGCSFSTASEGRSSRASLGAQMLHAVAQALRLRDNSRAAAAADAASHLQQQQRGRLAAAAKGSAVRSTASLYVIDEGDSVGVSSSSSGSGVMPSQGLQLQAAATTEATVLPGSASLKLRRSSSSSGSGSSLSRGGSSSLTAIGEWGLGGRRSTSGGSPDTPAKAATKTDTTSSSGSIPAVCVVKVGDPALSSSKGRMTYKGAHLVGDTALVAAGACMDQPARVGAAHKKMDKRKSGGMKDFFSSLGLGCFSKPKVDC